MRLRSCLKRYKKDTHRALPPEKTLEIVERMMPAAGITRVADITNLDRIGIPVFTSIRPTAEKGAISVYNGKGATPTEAKVSAIMEGIERYSAELRNADLKVARFPELRENALNPDVLILPRGADPDAEIPWVRGYDLIGDEEILVPANAVFHPLPSSYTRLFRTNTTGLASGNQLEEAIYHGLAEVVERDAWSVAEHARSMGPLLQYNGDGLAGELLEMFRRAEVEVYVRNITSDVNVPTFAAVSDDVKLKDPALLTAGMGTHTDPEVALLRALTEVAQSRLTQIHGAREDTVSADFRRMMGYERLKRLNRHWFEYERKESFSSIKSYATDDFLDDIRHMLDQLQAAGFERAIVVDLTAPEIMVPVVRVIVPGLEISAVDPERVGKRCRDAKDRRVSGSKHAS